jgi:head-tail adaptor
VNDPGLRESLVTFERGTASTDDYGGDTMTWATVTTAYANVRYGTGEDRRQAAQERAAQAATFECDWNPTLATVALTDRINWDGDFWDITSRSPMGHNEIHFAAVRSS